MSNHIAKKELFYPVIAITLKIDTYITRFLEIPEIESIIETSLMP